ncbi:IS66 family transposase [Vibrio gigantis]|uniref:IS66 family transposase n=1 Tax=Vibrio gigantis TaxID=296199 RepID=A0A5M9NYM4_9VIBR|nr:IS66 family transposase [Vibrio gigantis]KAA8675615.1 IS66 family transposase [Vibrio gigantis]
MPNKNKEDELALLRSKVTELESTVLTLHQSLGESESNILTLRQSLDESKSNVLTLRQSLNESEITIQSLVEKLNLARRKRFGSSSETMPPQDLEFNEAETHADTTGEEEAADTQNDKTSEAKNTSSETKRRGRPKLPEDLPRERVVVDIPESEKTCSCCQSLLCKMGQSTSEKLVYIPAKLYVEVTERPKYVCRQCDVLGEKSLMLMAPPPASIIPKSIATPSLLAQIITNKYHYALPLYRQESLFRQYGLALSRKTMSQWILRCADKVEPLIALLKESLLAQDVLFADETTLTVLDDERKKSYIWLYGCGPDRGGNAKSPGIVLFDYQEGSRGHHCPEWYLSNYTGYLHVDGYKAYEKTEAKLVGCWAHARRKFIEAEQSQPKGKQGKGGKIQWAVNWFQKLYRVEQALKDKTREERYLTRQSKTQSQLNEFKAWLDKSVTQVPPKSKLGEAISYSLNQWSKLVRVIDDGRLSMDNNRAERSVRPFTVGRNKWLFSKTHNGARASAVLYSLIETAKANDCEPYEYLEYVLREIPKLKSEDDHGHLLPWNMPKTE